MMKNKLRWVGPMIVMMLIVAACGNNDEVTNPPENSTAEQQQQETQTNDDSQDGDATPNDETNTDSRAEAPYAFIEFDLEVDLDDKKDAIEVEYEYETNETEASYDDYEQDIHLSGKEAIEKLDEIFSSFTFTEDTANEEVLNTVIEAFDIPEDATIDLDIEFPNGTEKEYKQ